MKRLLPVRLSVALLSAALAVSLRAQGPPPQVPPVGRLWDVVEIGRYVFPARDNWPHCGSVATCASFFVPEHQCGVQVYELGGDGTWQGRSARGERGTEPDYAGFKRETHPNPDGKGLPGCIISIKNWASGPRKFLFAWPNQNDGKILTQQLRIRKLGDFFLHESVYSCLRDPLLGQCPEDGINDLLDEARRQIEELPRRQPPPPPPPPTPAVIALCARDPLNCPPGVNPLKAIKDEYLRDLRNQANGHWKVLPEPFITEFAKDYREIDLHRVQFAENIKTRHGQSITVCNQIFLAVAFHQEKRSSLQLMLHELYHSVQCAQRGGEDKFLDEYMAHVAGTILDQKNLDVHNDINLERDAEGQATRLISAFGWPLVLTNECSSKLSAIVEYREPAGTWTSRQFTVLSKQDLQLTTDNRYAHSDNPNWYLYAEEIGGSFRYSGTYPVIFNGSTYLTRERRESVEGDNFHWTVTCTAPNSRVTLPLWTAETRTVRWTW
jgi:hypothetical protein